MTTDMEKNQPQRDALAGKVQKHPKKRVKLIVGGVIALVVAAGGVIGYVTWMNDPVRLLTESFQNTLALEKTTYEVSFSDKSTDANLGSAKLSGQYDKSVGYAVKGDVSTKTSSYGIVLNVDMALDRAGNSYYLFNKVSSAPTADSQRQVSDMVQQTIQKALGSQWSKVTAGSKQSSYVCAVAALGKMQDNPALGATFVRTLAGSGGLTARVASTDSTTVAYELTVKDDKADKLVEAYKKTDFYKDLTKCSDTADTSADLIKGSTVRVTVDKQAKRITTIASSSKRAGGVQALQLSLTQAQHVTVTIPKDVAAASASPITQLAQ